MYSPYVFLKLWNVFSAIIVARDSLIKNFCLAVREFEAWSLLWLYGILILTSKHYKYINNKLHCTKKEILRIFSVNVTKSAGNSGFGHIYWKNLSGELHFCAVLMSTFHSNIWVFLYVLGLHVMPLSPIYTASKHGVVSFTHCFKVSTFAVRK